MTSGSVNAFHSTPGVAWPSRLSDAGHSQTLRHVYVERPKPADFFHSSGIKFHPNASCGMVHITRMESSDLWAVVLPCNLELFFSMQERIMWPACNTDVHRVAQTREACCSGNTNSAIAGQSGSRTTRKQGEGLDVLWKRKAQNPTVTRDRAEPDSSPQQRSSPGGRLVYMRLTVAFEFPDIHECSAGRYSTLPRSANMPVGEKYRPYLWRLVFVTRWESASDVM